MKVVLELSGEEPVVFPAEDRFSVGGMFPFRVPGTSVRTAAVAAWVSENGRAVRFEWGGNAPCSGYLIWTPSGWVDPGVYVSGAARGVSFLVDDSFSF